MAKLLIMCLQESDLSRLLASCFEYSTTAALNAPADWDCYDAFAILGGTQNYPAAILPKIQQALLEQRKKGKRVFCEFTVGAGEACFANPVPTNCDRPVCVKAGEESGTILDEQHNTRLPVQFLPEHANIWYQYVTRPDGYRKAPVPETNGRNAAVFEEEAGLLQCAFRMADFAKARFAPFAAWKNLLSQIVLFLGGEWNDNAADTLKKESYAFAGKQAVWQAAEHAAKWFMSSGVLVKNGEIPCAVREGVSSIILPDGNQELAGQIRLDCMGETALMYELRYQLYRREQDRQWADAIYDTVRSMQIKEGLHRGMVRGSLGWWRNASYQDDAARGFLLPLAARAFLTGDMQDEKRIRLAADYLLSTTGTDGLRMNQINWQSHTKECVKAARLEKRDTKWKNSGFFDTTLTTLKNTPAENPSGHYNGWYLAALLLCGMLLKEDKYIATGKLGIETIMQAYPWTAREHSQTQELCRLMLPLSLLYKCTHSPLHRQWLERIVDDLCRTEKRSGAFVEYDEGYTASCSRAASGECSVFSHNGDPVCDFLYSMNWLPVSLASAWYATRDNRFLELYKRNTEFIASVQITSPDAKLNGAWARAVDIETLEVSGVNNDREWSTWTIESGWTVAEIANGMLWGYYLGMLERPESIIGGLKQ